MRGRGREWFPSPVDVPTSLIVKVKNIAVSSEFRCFFSVTYFGVFADVFYLFTLSFPTYLAGMSVYSTACKLTDWQLGI